MDFSPAVCHNFLPSEHRTSLLHICITAPKKERKTEEESRKGTKKKENVDGKEKEDIKNT